MKQRKPCIKYVRGRPLFLGWTSKLLSLFPGIYCNRYEQQQECNAMVDRFRLHQESSVGEGRMDFPAAQVAGHVMFHSLALIMPRRCDWSRSTSFRRSLPLPQSTAFLFDRGTRCSEIELQSLHRRGSRFGPSIPPPSSRVYVS